MTVMGQASTIDLTGRRFGRLTVLCRWKDWPDFDPAVKTVFTKNAPHPRTIFLDWKCLCDCGRTAIVRGRYLRNGDTRSCGCLQRQYRATGRITHGGAVRGLSREYKAWRDMKERCYNPKKQNYKWYGGRGITVCERWRSSFAAFLADMGPCPPGLTLDRKDPNGHYEPDNCRWTTWAVQRGNTRRSKQHASLRSATT